MAKVLKLISILTVVLGIPLAITITVFGLVAAGFFAAGAFLAFASVVAAVELI